MNFIIADDDEIVIELIKEKFFNADSFNKLLAVATNGVQLVKLCIKYSPDIVITDIDMPVMNGLDAIKKIKKLQMPIKIIALSNYYSYDYYKFLIDAGSNAYVLKDLQFTFYELQKAIDSLMQGAFYIDHKIRIPKEKEILHIHINPLDDLNSYERKVIRLIYGGKTTNEIASEIGKNPKTIEKYRNDIYIKLGVKNAIELVKFMAYNHLTI